MSDFKLKYKENFWSKLLRPRDTIFQPKTDNYSKEEIENLFELGPLNPVFLHKGKAKKLFDLRLSFNESKYLLHTMKLSVDEIVKCIGNHKLKVEIIEKLCCSKDVLLSEVPGIISLVGGIGNFETLINRNLSLENIITLFKQLKLSYNDICLLINSGYRFDQIKTLIEEKFPSSGLVKLAKVITASEVWSIYCEDEQNLKFIFSVIRVLNLNQPTTLNAALESYQILYDSIPCNLYRSVINNSLKIGPIYEDESYEEILRYYMNLAGGEKLATIAELDVQTHISFKIAEKLIKHTKPSYIVSVDYFPVKPFILAIIWFALDISLAIKYLGDAKNINQEVLSRTILSFLISSMCGITGYFHSGGVGLPFPNITSYIKTIYNAQITIKTQAPNVYKLIPDRLKFRTNQPFENFIKERQIDAGRGLSMVYTFRVGDSFLRTLFGVRCLSSEMAKSVFKSLWPLPDKTESMRICFLYSNVPIYSKFDMKEIFVLIP